MLLAPTPSATTTNPWRLSCEPMLLPMTTASILPHLLVTLLVSVWGMQARTPALPGRPLYVSGLFLGVIEQKTLVGY